MALCFWGGPKYLVLMKVSVPISESTQEKKQITDKTYDESEMRTRQKQRVVTSGDPYGCQAMNLR